MSFPTFPLLTFPLLKHVHPRRAALSEDEPWWGLQTVAGRLVEISAHGSSSQLTVAMGLVLEAQQVNEPVVWVMACGSTFFPPDVFDAGVDLSALAVVRVSGARAAARVAEVLARSGAFALIVIDLGKHANLSTAIAGRLVRLAQRHHSAIVCLTKKPNDVPSVGSLCSLRVVAARQQVVERQQMAQPQPINRSRFFCTIKALKDKQNGPCWEHSEVVYGPASLH